MSSPPPKDVYFLIPRTNKQIDLHDKKDFVDMIKARILRCWERLELCGWAKYIPKNLYKCQKKGESESENVWWWKIKTQWHNCKF